MSAIANNIMNNYRRLSPGEAEEILIEGNKRFVNGELNRKDLSYKARLELFKNGQHPVAVVITCSDSRVAPEIVFDQGLGDIFVIRNAGNVVDSIELGSIEYAVKHLKVPLILVLGHEKCGAIKASIDGVGAGTHISTIVNQILPSIQMVQDGNRNCNSEELSSEVENENIKLSSEKLLRSSIIKEFVDKGEVKIVPAKYCLETGEVKLLYDDYPL